MKKTETPSKRRRVGSYQFILNSRTGVYTSDTSNRHGSSCIIFFTSLRTTRLKQMARLFQIIITFFYYHSADSRGRHKKRIATERDLPRYVENTTKVQNITKQAKHRYAVLHTINTINDIRDEPIICNAQKYMEIKEHCHKNQERTVQEQCFKHASVRSRILEDDQIHDKPHTRRFPEHMPRQNYQRILANYYLQLSAARYNYKNLSPKN